MAYRRKKKSSGFLHKCTNKINTIRRAKKASAKVRAVNSYQSCLSRKNIHTGLDSKKKRSSRRKR